MTATVRPVFTGLGAIAPTGNDVRAHWESVLAGKGALGLITRFDASGYAVRVAGEVSDFAAADHVPSRLLRETDAMTHMAFVATDEALADSGLDLASLSDLDISTITANSSGGVQFGQRELQKLYSEGPQAVGAYMSIAWFYAATTGQLSIRHGLRGPCGVMVSEQAGGLDALGQSRRMLAKGTRMVLSGGTDASLSPYGLVSQMANGLMAEGDRPERMFLPFDAAAHGYVPGEGGGMYILEDLAVAQARGAPRLYGELAGYAAGIDPRPGSGREPALRRVITLALDDARLHPDEVDVVFADGYGVAELDRVEADAIGAVFGAGGVPVTVPKTMTGRLYAGGAALDVVTALLCIRDGVIPPTVNLTDPAPWAGGIDLVRDQPRAAPVRAALVLARGYGGLTAAVVLTGVR